MDARCPVTLAEWFRTNGSCVGFTVINGSCVGKFETIPKDLLGELVINHTKFRKSVCRPKKDERVYKQDSRLMVTMLTLAIVEDSVVVLVGSRIAQKAIDATGGIPNHVLACRFPLLQCMCSELSLPIPTPTWSINLEQPMSWFEAMRKYLLEKSG